MKPVSLPTDRTPDAGAEGRPAIAYASYTDGERDQVDTLQQLAAVAAAAVDAHVEDRYLRAVTDAGERQLTRDEQRCLLVALTHVPRDARED